MRKTHITIFSSLILLLTACSKKSSPPALPAGSIAIQNISVSDTIVAPLSVLGDSAIVVGLKAELSGKVSSADHWVDISIDTTKIIQYQAKYGNAVLLPSSSYFQYKSMVRIPAGSSLSDSAQINIVQETKLEGYTTYVLPVIIKSVDGNPDGAQTDSVLYLVFKTGKPLVISKTKWTIASYSSYYGSFVPTNLLDNDNLTTYWTSNITGQMPQWVVINFNNTISFTAVNYYLPTALVYPAQGGYPTSIQIETSMDGSTWTDNGTYNGDISNKMQTINTGVCTGRYMRFTVLASVKYSSTYNCIFISGISLVP